VNASHFAHHHKPKRKQEKKTAKKKKKESHYFKGARIGMQGFWKKILPLLSFKKSTIEKKECGDFFTKYILTLQSNSDAPLPLLSFLFFGYMCAVQFPTKIMEG